MKIIASRQLTAQPAKVWAALEAEGVVVITRDGVPFSIMVPTSDATLVEDVEELVFARARRALWLVRSSASRTGTDRLSASVVDAEIRAARRERRPRARRG
jgi:hypothetical protein